MQKSECVSSSVGVCRSIAVAVVLVLVLVLVLVWAGVVGVCAQRSKSRDVATKRTVREAESERVDEYCLKNERHEMMVVW